MNTRGLQHTLSRRGFLRGTAGIAGASAFAGLLNGCAAPSGTEAGGAASSAPAASNSAVTDIYGISPASFADMGMHAATNIYNEQIAASGKRIILEESPDGWRARH